MEDITIDTDSDIDPQIAEVIFAHSDDFIDADNTVDEIIDWGMRELKVREAKIQTSGGSLEDFKDAAREVEQLVKSKLAEFEEDLKKRYPTAESEPVE
jgi:hypothetical protein